MANFNTNNYDPNKNYLQMQEQPPSYTPNNTFAQNQTENFTQPQPNQEGMYNYQQEAVRLYIANVVLTNQVKELLAEKGELLNRISKLEKRQTDGNLNSAEEKKKRIRRPANEIERAYKCVVENCNKSYGTEGSLAQHIKLKHPEFFNQMPNNMSQALSKMRAESQSKKEDETNLKHEN